MPEISVQLLVSIKLNAKKNQFIQYCNKTDCWDFCDNTADKQGQSVDPVITEMLIARENEYIFLRKHESLKYIKNNQSIWLLQLNWLPGKSSLSFCHNTADGQRQSVYPVITEMLIARENLYIFAGKHESFKYIK